MLQQENAIARCLVHDHVTAQKGYQGLRKVATSTGSTKCPDSPDSSKTAWGMPAASYHPGVIYGAALRS